MARIVDLPARTATDTEDDNASAPPTVVLDGEQLVIRELLVRGAPADAVRHCIEQGGDAEDSVRRMLDIGGMVLQHGANSALVQAVLPRCAARGSRRRRSARSPIAWPPRAWRTRSRCSRPLKDRLRPTATS